MAARLKMQYSPEGVLTLKEERFIVESPRAKQERAGDWAREYARNLSRKREMELAHARLMIQRAKELHEQIQSAVNVANAALAERFRRLVNQWSNETGHYSLAFKRAMHPAYQQIIGMGDKALPFILTELRNQPTGHWFWALNAITGKEATLGEKDIDAAIQAWLKWGTERGHI